MCRVTINTPGSGFPSGDSIALRPKRAVFAAFVSCLVLASPPLMGEHIVEFQIEASKLIELVDDRLAEEDVCYPTPFQLPGFGGELVLDHLEFPGPTLLQRDGQQLRLVVPVSVYTKTVACMSDPNCGPQNYTPPFPLTIPMVLDLSARIGNDGKLAICVTPAENELLGAVGGFSSPMCSKIDIMKSLKKLLKGEPPIKKVGLSANNILDRIAVRIEFENPDDPAAPPATTWDGFFDGQVGPSPAGMEWSIFINQDLLLHVFKKRFESKLDIIEGPNATWVSDGPNGGTVLMDFTADFDVPLCPNSIAADADVVIDLSVDGSVPNILQAHGTIETDVVDSDVGLCVFLTGGVASGAAPIVLATLGIIASTMGPDSGDLPDECTLNDDGDEFDCQYSVDLPAIRMSKYKTNGSTQATLTMDRIFGSTQGPVMGGPVTITFGPPPNPPKLLSVGPAAFEFGVRAGAAVCTWAGTATSRSKATAGCARTSRSSTIRWASSR